MPDAMRLMVKSVTVVYRLEEDDEDLERSFDVTIRNPGGFPLNAVVWGHKPDLINKLRVVAGPNHPPKPIEPNPTNAPRRPDWDSNLPDHGPPSQPAASEKFFSSHCTWIHDVDCNWWENCE
jgi:hypothetical protein